MAKLESVAWNKAVRDDKSLDRMYAKLLKGEFLAQFEKVTRLTFSPPPIADFAKALKELEKQCKVFERWYDLVLLNTVSYDKTIASYADAEQHHAVLLELRTSAFTAKSEALAQTKEEVAA